MNSNVKSIFYCKNCGNESLKWEGKCPFCKEWNSFVEKKIAKKKNKVSSSYSPSIAKPQLIDEIQREEYVRLHFLDPEFNRIVGNGLMQGSITLIAGEPGIGKSTLFLQLGLAEKKIKTLYISGEESLQQIKERAERIHQNNAQLYLYTGTHIEDIIKEAGELKPDWMIVDSIQTISSSSIDASPGSMIQLRETTIALQQFAKATGIPVILIGHINKEGAIAGPKVLEHIVDAVVIFEGDRYYNYRMLRTIKNRFGNALEIGIYEMNKQGLLPVSNPNELLMTARDQDIAGSSIGCINEGIRTFFVEVQALVTSTYYATPQRTVNGVEHRKLQLVSAILEKRCQIQLSIKDIFLTLVGGIKTNDPSIDLAISVAIVSSYFDITIPSHFCFIGELGLSGEIRSVTKMEQRIKEAVKTGFHTIVCSPYNFKETVKYKDIRVYTLNDLSDLILLLKRSGK